MAVLLDAVLLNQLWRDLVEVLLYLRLALFVDLRVRVRHHDLLKVAAALDLRIGVLLSEAHQQILKGIELVALLAVFECSFHLAALVSAV